MLEGIKMEVQENLKDIIIRSEKLIKELRSDTQCLLCELEDIKKGFYKIQSAASTFYLRAYLSNYIEDFDALATAINHLAQTRHGALIVVQRHNEIASHIHRGITVNAELSSSLIESIFYPGNPLHDGAVLIKESMILSAANVLPLSSINAGESKLGTRHRAAIGLSERTDALILVVSEETGKLSFAKDGSLYPISTNNL
ncbi:sporulation-specific diadenylate cyclase CdaS [Metabacillus sp. RGM 3146]|uniref:sporulation-specific diadenylate cyclase CdaS n=1 Tax=Metabacillus sp. RGM 3146 TaxID=3401092 RepID=UPI003B997E9B